MSEREPYTVDDILAEVRLQREKEKQKEERQAALGNIDDFLEPRKRIGVEDILTDSLLQEVGVSADDVHETNTLSSTEDVQEELEESDEKTQVIITNDKTRKTPVFERPGVVTKFIKSNAPEDLEPLPILLSADEAAVQMQDSDKTIVHQFIKTDMAQVPVEEKKQAEQITGQIRFDVFDESETVIEKVNENEIEKELKQRRKEKMKSFKISLADEIVPEEEIYPEEIDLQRKEKVKKEELKTRPIKEFSSLSLREKMNDLNTEEEYTSVKQAPQIAETIAKRQSVMTTSLIVQGISIVVLLVLQILGTQMQTSPLVFFIVSIVALIASGAFSIPLFMKGIQEIKKKRPGIFSSAVLVWGFSFIQAILWYALKGNLKEIPLYTIPSIVFLLLLTFGQRIQEKRILKNFAFMNKLSQVHAITTLDDEDVVTQIGRDLHAGNPDIRYSAKTKFPSNFLYHSYHAMPDEKLAVKLFLPIVVLSSVIAIGYGIFSKNALSALSVMQVMFTVTFPSAVVLAYQIPLLGINKKLHAKGGMISGFTAIESVEYANAVIIDSSYIYEKGGCEIYGIKPFNKMRIDEAILDTAALVIEAGGPCGEVFDRVIQGKRELLPPVEDWIYEDRLGLSAWVHGQRVLVGNRDLLLNHGVEVPERAYEEKYRHDNRQIMYLAVAGKIAAMYLVGYNPREGIGELLHELENNGVTLLIRTSDANVTEELLANSFGLSKDAIKVISARAGDLYMKEQAKVLDVASSEMVHDGGVLSMLATLASGLSFANKRTIPLFLQMAVSVLGVILVALFAFISGFAQLGILQVVSFQVVFTLLFTVLGSMNIKK